MVQKRFPKIKIKIGPSLIKYSVVAIFLLPVFGVEDHYYYYSQNTSNDAVPRKEVPFGGRESKI